MLAIHSTILTRCGMALLLACLATSNQPANAQVTAPIHAVNYHSPAGAGYCEGTKCWVTQGKTAVVRVQGAGVAAATHVADTSSGLTSSLTGWTQVGRIEVQLQVAASTGRGNKTVTLQQKAPNGTVVTQWKFDVFVINDGRITSVDMLPKTAFYNEAEITAHGSNLGNARLTLFEYDLRTVKPTVTKVSNSSTQVRIRLNWSTPQSAATFGIRLCDEAMPPSPSCFPTAGTPMWGEIKGAVQGPPALVGILAGPPQPQVNSLITIRFTLWGPAPSGGTTVWWKLTPATDFQAEPGSCAYSSLGLMNQVTINTGTTYRECVLRMMQVTGTGSRLVDAWTVDNSRSDAPYRKTHGFAVANAGTTSTAFLQGLILSNLYKLGSGTTTDDAGNNYVPLTPFLNNPHCTGTQAPNPAYTASGHQRSNRVNITVPNIQWQVRNNGSTMVTSATARLKNGVQVLQSQFISNLASGASTAASTYPRVNNTTCVARLGNDGGCYHCGTASQGWNDNHVMVQIQ